MIKDSFAVKADCTFEFKYDVIEYLNRRFNAGYGGDSYDRYYGAHQYNFQTRVHQCIFGIEVPKDVKYIIKAQQFKDVIEDFYDILPERKEELNGTT